ncbi:MAG: manganese catalase family protein [Clostridia bacterium]|nr:manganese catalase family protein [Clostridia bacterium]
MNLEDVVVKANSPYPQIENAIEDKTTVMILKNLLSARSGEVNGVMQYLYQSEVANKTNSEIADVFEEISIVEMMHLKLLMDAIIKFGGNPKFEDAQGNMFNAGYVNYSNKLRDMLESNIFAESKAIENYEEAIKRVSNESLKKLLARIIEDEELHIKVFKKIRDNVEFLSI